jgi:c-di-GMP-binding flagellar brake protein YcgR
MDTLKKENRQHRRIWCNVPIRYKNVGRTGVIPVGALTADISASGVRFKTGDFISLSDRLILEISIPTVFGPVKAISRVVWIRKTPSHDQYEIGSQFIDMNKHDKMAVINFINGA